MEGSQPTPRSLTGPVTISTATGRVNNSSPGRGRYPVSLVPITSACRPHHGLGPDYLLTPVLAAGITALPPLSAPFPPLSAPRLFTTQLGVNRREQNKLLGSSPCGVTGLCKGKITVTHHVCQGTADKQCALQIGASPG